MLGFCLFSRFFVLSPNDIQLTIHMYIYVLYKYNILYVDIYSQHMQQFELRLIA